MFQHAVCLGTITLGELRNEAVQRVGTGVVFLFKRLQILMLEVWCDVVFSAYHSCFEGSDIRVLADFN